MRLWSIHPRYLDPKGLVALWREALLAQKVLRGETRGYSHHPQLARFRESDDPGGAIAAYLAAVYTNACERSYRFDRSKIGMIVFSGTLPVTDGQIDYEWRHLMQKFRRRCPAYVRTLRGITLPEPHPLFRVVPGPVEPWERAH